MKLLNEIPGIQVHHFNGQTYIFSRRHALWISNNDATSRLELNKLPVPMIKRMATSRLLGARLLRGGIHAVVPGNRDLSKWLVVAEGKIYLFSSRDCTIRPIYEIQRGRRPLRRGLCVVGDNLFIGEYCSNPERTAVNVHKIHIPTQKAEPFYQFGEKTVRHIHTVDKDPHGGKLWVSTGDEDPECRIVLLDPHTGQAETIGAGSQKWRTVSFAFRPDAVYWGTDNHLGANQIWRFDRATGHTKPVGDVIGPVYYNACLKDYVVFGTTVEKGEGQQDGYGRLYAVNRQDRVAEVWKQRKDRWHPRWFGYGVFEFAEGSGYDNQFWVTEKGFEPGLRSLLFELSDE